MRVAYFTAGSAGAGHLVRGVAIARALDRARPDASRELRIFSPPSAFAHVAERWLEPVVIEPALLRSKRTADESAVARALRAYAPDVLVIDLFWAPLVFVTLSCPTVLLLRSVPAAWLVGPAEARFDHRRYERVFAIEPAPGLDRFEPLSPIVVSTRAEARDRSALRALLDRRDGPLRIIARGGLESDHEQLARVAHELDAGPWDTLDLSSPSAPFPAAEWLAAMEQGDRLVACPGYNLYWEARTLGFDAHTTWVPIARKLDAPAMRAALTGPAPRSNGADELARILLARG
ncbi:MAG: hypothetical protein U0269_06655 [Polyangiales bacterium]